MGADDGDKDDSGAVYLYTLNSTSNTWDFEQKIVASDGAEYDNFGYAVAISETGHLLVGARYDDDMGSASGSVYAIGEGVRVFVFCYSCKIWMCFGSDVSHLSSLSHYQMAFDAEGGDTSESETFCTTTTTTTTTVREIACFETVSSANNTQYSPPHFSSRCLWYP